MRGLRNPSGRLWPLLMALLALMVVLNLGCAKEEGEEIKIGALLPLSGDGAKYGEEARNGIELAIQDVNSSGGVNGARIRIIYEDDEGTQKGAISGFNKLVTAQKVAVVIGPMYSSTTLAVAPIAERNRIILLSPSASSPDVTEAGDFVFRNWPSDVFEGGKMARFAYTELGVRRVALLAVNVDYGVGLAEVFKGEFTRLGAEIVAEEKYDQGASDFRTQLAKIKAVAPEAIYLPGYYTEIALILKQARELGFKLRILSCVGFDNPKGLELAGDAAEGVIFARPAYDPASVEEPVASFVSSFRNKYGIEPGTYAAHAYDALKIVAKAIAEGGSTSHGIKKALYRIKDFPGVTGSTSIDGNGDVVKPIQIMVVKGGVFAPYQ